MTEPIRQSQLPPSNYLVFAILVTFFCCQVFGIVSLVFAAQVNSKWNAGDVEGAIKASKNAKLWALVGVISGMAIGLIVTILAVFGVFAGLAFGGFTF